MSAELFYTNNTNSNDFTEARILSDWKYRSEPNKVGLLTFRSPKKLSGGTHVKLENNGVPLFGGQIVKSSAKKNDFYNYDALDYKRYLLKPVTLEKKNITASSVAKLLAKKVPILDWNIKATKKKHKELIWDDTTVLSILNQLIWLEYKEATNLILFNVDYDCNLTFRPYPQTSKGYIFTEALDYTSSLDYNNIKTGYELVDSKGNVISQSTNTKLQAIWGDIPVHTVFNDENTD